MEKINKPILASFLFRLEIFPSSFLKMGGKLSVLMEML
jgi:hypothetical protein